MLPILPTFNQIHSPVPEVFVKAPYSFAVKDGNFYLNGQKTLLLAGEVHPARIPRAYWRQRIEMARAMGMNAIACYVFWNYQEPEPGQFDWKGRHDIAAFVKLCGEMGMPVLLRPGPYCCAEWEFGGYPYWLQNIKGIKIRTDDPIYLAETAKYFKALGDQLKGLQASVGGPIITVQVENEYGSYGKSRPYMEAVRKQLIDSGFNVPLVIADGPSQLANDYIPGLVVGVNGGGADLKKTTDLYMPGGPYITTEFYPGWLDHWGEGFIHTDGDTGTFEKLIQNGISISMYMFHGGTNFGFYNGANYSDHFEPHITSYDYDAPLSEAGHVTEKFLKYRKIIQDNLGVQLPPVPANPPVQTIEPFALKPVGNYWTVASKADRGLFETPPTFEALHQAYGFVLYRHQFSSSASGTVTLPKLSDYAIVMLNGQPIAILDRRLHQDSFKLSVEPSGGQLDILVENMGRINYGHLIPDNLKGLVGGAFLDGAPINKWSAYSMPLSEGKLPKFSSPYLSAGSPTFYEGSFETKSNADTFINTDGWGKGVLFVNGHNLGRFWSIGPQKTLYCPGVWLKKGKNQVLVFEETGFNKGTLQGDSTPILDAPIQSAASN